ncbi:MAG: helix-turn-helix domain-containing protein, partial [Alphaproteobacteria bacterium]|nr:helix-turn-helix domain-containing protein [Alphaproteobacteria bacterium]
RPNKHFSRIELAKKLSFQVSDRTIDVQINRLRKKIGDNPKSPTIVRTIRYIGYALYTNN